MSAWKIFQQRYPNADLGRFTQKDWFGDSSNSVVWKSKDGDEILEVYGKGKFIYRNHTKEMKKDLGLEMDFPVEMGLNSIPKLPVPALGVAYKPQTFHFSNLEIFVTPTDSFKMKFHDIFTDTKLTHHSSKESHRCLNSPDMNYWPQQLNFAVWCATTGCGISSRILFEDKMKDGIHDVTDNELHLPKQVRSFIWFHVYFTIRRILHELGGIQSSVG